MDKITWDKIDAQVASYVKVEEEKNEKGHKLKVWLRFQIQNFSTFKDGRLTSNSDLKNVGSLYFLYIRGLSDIYGLTKKTFNSKKKKSIEIFFTKKEE